MIGGFRPPLGFPSKHVLRDMVGNADNVRVRRACAHARTPTRMRAHTHCWLLVPLFFFRRLSAFAFTTEAALLFVVLNHDFLL